MLRADPSSAGEGRPAAHGFRAGTSGGAKVRFPGACAQVRPAGGGGRAGRARPCSPGRREGRRERPRGGPGARTRPQTPPARAQAGHQRPLGPFEESGLRVRVSEQLGAGQRRMRAGRAGPRPLRPVLLLLPGERGGAARPGRGDGGRGSRHREWRAPHVRAAPPGPPEAGSPSAKRPASPRGAGSGARARRAHLHTVVDTRGGRRAGPQPGWDRCLLRRPGRGEGVCGFRELGPGPGGVLGGVSAGPGNAFWAAACAPSAPSW